MAATDTPGPGTLAPSRYTAMIARENNSLRRRSGVRNAAANACSTCPPLLGRLRLAMDGAGPVERRPYGRCTSGRPTGRPWRISAGRDADDPGAPSASRGHLPSDQGGAAPGRADLLGRGRREGVRVHVHLDAAEVAGAQDLDRLAAADRAGVGQAVGVDRTALREERGDPVEVDDLEDDLVRVLEAGQLGQAHVQRCLAALEAGGDVAARAGALGAATGGLALGALTASHAGLGGVGALGRTQVVDLESHGES